MKYLKLTNITTSTGNMDYKGLDIKQFMPTTQFYEIDLKYCIIGTNQDTSEMSDIILLDDVEELTESTYEQIKAEILSHIPRSPEQIEIENLKLLVADLALNSMGGGL